MHKQIPPRLRVQIGERLRLFRELIVDASQPKLAKIVGVTTQAWSQWETGKRPLGLCEAIILCRRYGATLDWLYRGEESGLPVRLAEKLRTDSKAGPDDDPPSPPTIHRERRH